MVASSLKFAILKIPVPQGRPCESILLELSRGMLLVKLLLALVLPATSAVGLAAAQRDNVLLGQTLSQVGRWAHECSGTIGLHFSCPLADEVKQTGLAITCQLAILGYPCSCCWATPCMHCLHGPFSRASALNVSVI